VVEEEAVVEEAVVEEEAVVVEKEAEEEEAMVVEQEAEEEEAEEVGAVEVGAAVVMAWRCTRGVHVACPRCAIRAALR
jgi:hypothetical protein